MILVMAGACPPEDVGGVYGYEEFCEAMTNPTHDNHKKFTDCYNSIAFFKKPFDPEFFDKNSVNDELNKYLRWSRSRQQPF